MFSTLPQTIQDELAQLVQRYGQPIVQSAELQIHESFDPLSKTDRYGEVCMVIRRKNGRLLTMIKTFYPEGAYRLLTGGINHGEYVFDALLRETQEETGLQVEVKHFLAVATYHLENTNQTPAFYTFAFLLDELGGTLGAIDEDEQVGEFREIAPEELPTLAEHLERLGDQYSEQIGGRWAYWGRFRAVIHRLVWQALQ
ncbi:NUDIX hydrolase [Dictyobacter aurantiacus]|uniref:NUDIX hydrolase n=1 Tax=Dictyobacter aurantiacus TaxID=1936993 RepID=A0A401ZHD2_9CHLR|nr:NUDIX hydrolase [Dictyobacter aurantiacus]GCE06295.1 NUDIX hydrolase [Dictyobacter aurantiacus]